MRQEECVSSLVQTNENKKENNYEAKENSLCMDYTYFLLYR